MNSYITKSESSAGGVFQASQVPNCPLLPTLAVVEYERESPGRDQGKFPDEVSPNGPQTCKLNRWLVNIFQDGLLPRKR